MKMQKSDLHEMVKSNLSNLQDVLHMLEDLDIEVNEFCALDRLDLDIETLLKAQIEQHENIMRKLSVTATEADSEDFVKFTSEQQGEIGLSHISDYTH